jgi:ribosomal protein S18 acetylase RimI-like enzyme
MNTFNIKSVETEEELKKLYYFVSKVFYDDAKENNEHYYPMYDTYTKMYQQFERNKKLLLYIEEDNQIVAAVTAKDMTETTITISTLAVDKKYRGKDYAKDLIMELEKQLKKIGITSISL